MSKIQKFDESNRVIYRSESQFNRIELKSSWHKRQLVTPILFITIMLVVAIALLYVA